MPVNTKINYCYIDGCQDRCVGRGLCNKHYRAWRRHGDPLINKRQYSTLQSQIKSAIQEKDGHWIWQKSTSGGGSKYGSLENNGRKLLAHRASYEAFIGKIPTGLNVCHSCDIPLCVNPAHLFLGSQKDNHADMVKKNRQANREKHGMSKLSENNIINIKHMIKDGINQRKIAKYYAVTQAAISLINRNKTWKHVTI